MAARSMSYSTWEEIDKLMKDESFCRMSDSHSKASSQQVNVSESSTAATPDHLNSGFIDVTVVQEGSTTTESCEKHSQTIEPAVAVEEPPLVHDIVEQDNNDVNHHTPTKPGVVSTGTMPKTPNVRTIGTMASTPKTKSTGTTTEIIATQFKSTMTIIPETTATGTTTKLQTATSIGIMTNPTSTKSIGTMTTTPKYASFSQ